MIGDELHDVGMMTDILTGAVDILSYNSSLIDENEGLKDEVRALRRLLIKFTHPVGGTIRTDAAKLPPDLRRDGTHSYEIPMNKSEGLMHEKAVEMVGLPRPTLHRALIKGVANGAIPVDLIRSLAQE